MGKHFFKILLVVSLVLFGYSAYSLFASSDKSIAYGEGEEIQNEEEVINVPIPEKVDRVEVLEIGDGDTFGILMDEVEIGYSVQMKIYNASKDLYDLVKIRQGRSLNLVFDKDTDEFKELIYQIDSEERLHVERVLIEKEVATSTEEVIEEERVEEYEWQAERRDIEYEVRIKSAGGTVESSMYQAALDNDIDERAIIELANAFQWTIDFAMDPRVGDTFKFVYEERYLDGEYVMPGSVLAGQYVNEGEAYEVYYFEETDENSGYFDEDGNSVQKMFLKAPVSFKYISSGFTTGRRYVEAFNVSTGHKAIDYAAALGTPIRAVGDGKITFAGWNSSGYGNLIKMRHNGTYSTNYAHLSKFAVRTGQRVKQGDVIGYVGSTGFSTGPHLHYEMIKNGAKINPLREVLPPGKSVKEENKERFFEEKERLEDLMKK